MGDSLSPREEAILLGLLEDFLRTRQPVASKAIAGRTPQQLSPATVRTILNRLEDLGYLSQPHPSAGRVPTDEAYRYFARRVLERPAADSGGEGDAFDRLSLDGSLNAAVRDISSALALSVHSLGFAATPAVEEIRLRSCELVPVGPGRVLCVVISEGGLVHEKLLRSDGEFTPEQLRWLSGFVSESYAGWTFAEIRRDLAAQIEGERAACDRQIRRALLLVAPYFLASSVEREVFWNGEGWLLAAPELRANLDSVRALLESLKAKSVLLDLLDDLARGGVPLRVVLGDEWPDPAVQDLAMVAAPFGGKASGYGIVGVIGPKALRYDAAIPMVRRAARLATLASARL